MAKHDRYTCSAQVGTDPKTARWTPMWDVPKGKSPITEAEDTIAEFDLINEVGIYRNGRFIRYVYAPVKAVACNA